MFELPERIRDGLLNYLSNKPYREVAEAISVLQMLKPIPPKSEETGGTGSSRMDDSRA